jgi:hypothetical protein
VLPAIIRLSCTFCRSSECEDNLRIAI